MLDTSTTRIRSPPPVSQGPPRSAATSGKNKSAPADRARTRFARKGHHRARRPRDDRRRQSEAGGFSRLSPGEGGSFAGA